MGLWVGINFCWSLISSIIVNRRSVKLLHLVVLIWTRSWRVAWIVSTRWFMWRVEDNEIRNFGWDDFKISIYRAYSTYLYNFHKKILEYFISVAKILLTSTFLVLLRQCSFCLFRPNVLVKSLILMSMI